MNGTAEGIRSNNEVDEQLRRLRLLTEVNTLRAHMLPNGTIPPAVISDERPNYITAVQEIGMPSAVSTTIQRVDFETDQEGRVRRIFKWLGKSATQVAQSGYDFHFSEPAFLRVECEKAEAGYSQETLQTGITQSFISPRMSAADAPLALARQEHLGDDDAIRTSEAVIDKHGAVIGRRLQSLLVRDVPLSAWVAMLQDPGNLWGRSINVENPDSALSVMQQFHELDLPKDRLPEGPVTIVEAVLPYIDDIGSKQSVQRQLHEFRHDQVKYQRQAELAAAEWLAFDIELARSLTQGSATKPIERFIASLQHQWSADELNTIVRHDVAGEYVMTEDLAVVLERAKRNVVVSQAGIAVGNREILRQTDLATARRLQTEVYRLEMMHAGGASAHEIAAHQANLVRLIAEQNFRPRGGCAGSAESSFKTGRGGSDVAGNGESADAEDSSNWTWKRGVCRVQKCPSPQPTEVGPCSVCRSCQYKFDHGQDPTSGSRVDRAEIVEAKDTWKYFLKVLERRETTLQKPLAIIRQ